MGIFGGNKKVESTPAPGEGNHELDRFTNWRDAHDRVEAPQGWTKQPAGTDPTEREPWNS